MKFIYIYVFIFIFNTDIYAKNYSYVNDAKSQIKLDQIRVNEKIYTAKDINVQFSFIKYLYYKNYPKNYKLRDIEILDKIIQNELLYQKANQLKIIINQDEIDKNIENFIDKNFDNFKNFEKISKINNWNIDMVKREIKIQFIWKKIINEIIKPFINTSQIEVMEWFEKEKIFNKNYRYLLKKIQIIDDKIINAIDINYYDLINKNKYNNYIENIVSLYSNENVSIDVNWYWNTELNQVINDAINNINIGEYSKPIKIDKFWYIFKIIDKKFDYNLTIEEYNEIVNKINNKKLDIAIENFLNEIKKSSYIQVK